MNTEDRSLVLVTARLLRSFRLIDWLSTGITLLAAVAAFEGRSGLILLGGAIALGLAEKVYGFRIAFDAGLFDAVVDGKLDAPSLDQALTRLGLRPEAMTSRGWTDRCRGAKRLIAIGAILTLVQVAVFLTAAAV